MFFNTKEKPKDITKQAISKEVKINNEACCITLKNAFYVKEDGQDILLDEIVIDNMINDIAQAVKKNNTKYNPIPKSIVISNEQDNKSEINNKEEEKCFNSYKPRCSLDEVYLEEGARKQIMAALAIEKHKDKLFTEWGLQSNIKNSRSIILNFYGAPGTGKSMTAEAVANKLNKSVMLVNYAELESKYVGETPKNIINVFRKAQEENAVLIFDEADSFLGKRLTNINQSADYGVNITRSVMLLELERFEGVVIFTTNLIENYDQAFKRRILANVEFKMPDENGRKKIWDKHLTSRLPLEEDITSDYLSAEYCDITGADIKDIVLYAALLCLESGEEKLNKHHFHKAFLYIKSRYNNEDFIIKHETITREQYENETRQMQVEG